MDIPYQHWKVLAALQAVETSRSPVRIPSQELKKYAAQQVQWPLLGQAEIGGTAHCPGYSETVRETRRKEPPSKGGAGRWARPVGRNTA